MGNTATLIRRLCWTLIAFAIATAIFNLTLSANVFATDIPESTDLVDRLLIYRGWDQQNYPLAVVSNLPGVGVFVLAALIGIALRAYAPPGLGRDLMATVFVIGGIVGVVSQLMNLAVNEWATFGYCDCGYKTYEVIAQDYALSLGWNIQTWLNIAAVAIVGAALGVAGRIVNISRDWSIVSYLIVIGLAIGVVLQLANLDQTAQIVVGITAGIGVPVWAFLLARATRAPAMTGEVATS